MQEHYPVRIHRITSSYFFYKRFAENYSRTPDNLIAHTGDNSLDGDPCPPVKTSVLTNQNKCDNKAG